MSTANWAIPLKLRIIFPMYSNLPLSLSLPPSSSPYLSLPTSLSLPPSPYLPLPTSLSIPLCLPLPAYVAALLPPSLSPTSSFLLLLPFSLSFAPLSLSRMVTRLPPTPPPALSFPILLPFSSLYLPLSVSHIWRLCVERAYVIMLLFQPPTHTYSRSIHWIRSPDSRIQPVSYLCSLVLLLISEVCTNSDRRGVVLSRSLYVYVTSAAAAGSEGQWSR